MSYVFTLVTAALLTTVLMPLFIRLGERVGMIDQPNARKVHREPIPRSGGGAVVLGALAPLAAVLPWTPLKPGFFLGTAVITLFGVLDDLKSLDYRWKLVGQIAAAVLAVTFADLRIHTLFTPRPGMPIDPGVFGFPLAVFFLVAATNTINLADGLDGLAGGICLLTLTACGFLAYLQGSIATLFLAMSLIGAILGFLRHNTNPASVFLGDTGSQFLGFTVGFTLLSFSQGPGEGFSLPLALFFMGVPVFDTALVICERLMSGHHLLQADRKHIHHRLLRMGMAQSHAVLVIYALHLGLILLGWSLLPHGDVFLLGAYAALLLSVLLIFLVPGKRERLVTRIGPWLEKLKRTTAGGGPGLVSRPVLASGAWYMMVGSLAVFLVVTAAMLPEVAPDIGAVSLGFLVANTLAAFFLRRHRGFLLRMSAYFISTYLILAWEFQRDTFPPFLGSRIVYNALFGALGCGYFGYLFASLERIPLVTMDYLLLGVVLLTLFLPPGYLAAYHVHSVSARILLVFLAIELAAWRFEGSLKLLRIPVLAALAATAVLAFYRP